MINFFKRKQLYCNVFMSIMFNSNMSICYKWGIGTTKWPVSINDLQRIADDLAIMTDKNAKNIVITSICYTSNVYKI